MLTGSIPPTGLPLPRRSSPLVLTFFDEKVQPSGRLLFSPQVSFLQLAGAPKNLSVQLRF